MDGWDAAGAGSEADADGWRSRSSSFGNLSTAGSDYDSMAPHMRTALLAYKSSNVPRTKAIAGNLHHHNRLTHCRHKIHHFLEASEVQSCLVILIIVEVLAVTGETLIERGWLNFDGPVGEGEDQPLNSLIYNVLHLTSISILCTFEVEFMLMFFAEGPKCLCKHGVFWIWLDVVVVTTALVVEIFYRYFKYGMTEDGKLSDESIIFILTLRIIRICNGILQQHLRYKEIRERMTEEIEQETEERYLDQIRQMVQQADEVQAELVEWKAQAQKQQQRADDLAILSKVQQEQLLAAADQAPTGS